MKKDTLIPVSLILRQCISVLVTLSLLLTLVPIRVYGEAKVNDDDLDAINLDAVWHVPDEGCSPVGNTSGSGDSANPDVPAPVGAANTDYAGKPILTQGQLDLIQKNSGIYQQAAQTVDIPWQIIAVVHLRETGLGRRNPANGQGIYQFVDKRGGPYPAGDVTEAEFLRQTNFVAQFLRGKVAASYPQNRTLTAANPSPEAVKDLFFSYNGRSGKYAQQAAVAGFDPATQGYEGSPYVMNRADAKRDPNVNKTTWGQVKRDFGPIEYPANQGHGAFVVYASLSGISVTSSGTDTCVATDPNSPGPAVDPNAPIRQKIVTLAQQELALWQNGTLKPGTGYKKYSQGRAENWCADFTSWIYNQAGKPLSNTKEGNVPAVTTQMQIGKQTGRWRDKSGYTPAPGDIVVRKNGQSHVNLVVSVSGTWPSGTMVTIGGNQGGGSGGFNASKVTTYSEPLTNGGITGYVSAE